MPLEHDTRRGMDWNTVYCIRPLLISKGPLIKTLRLSFLGVRRPRQFDPYILQPRQLLVEGTDINPSVNVLLFYSLSLSPRFGCPLLSPFLPLFFTNSVYHSPIELLMVPSDIKRTSENPKFMKCSLHTEVSPLKPAVRLSVLYPQRKIDSGYENGTEPTVREDVRVLRY